MNKNALAWTATSQTEHPALRGMIASAKAGDSEAFAQIMLLNEAMVLRVAQRILLDNDEAKDVAQEVFLRLHGALKQFDARKEIAPWLYRITVNLCRDKIRRARKNVRLNLAEHLLAAGDNPETTALAAQQYRLLIESLAQLAPREREAIVLRDLEGKSTREVAELLEISENTVRSQLSTGRIKMKNFVSNKLRNRP